MEHESRVINETNGGMYIEEVFVPRNSANIIFLAPHGGAVEPRTTEQAIQAMFSVESAASMWGTRGYDKSGPFESWHPSSSGISADRHEFLRTKLEPPYDVVVSFHVKSESGITVGGRDSMSRRTEVADSLRGITEDVEVVENGPYAGKHPSNIANRLSKEGGIQIETGPSPMYDDSKWRVARSVAEVVNDLGV